MMVAYLRGLLKPDYPNGIRSVIRENLVLQALDRELEAQEVVTRISMESNYVSIMRAEQANKLLKHHDKMLSLAFENYKHKISKRKTKHNVDLDSVERLIEAYKILQKQNFKIIPKEN